MLDVPYFKQDTDYSCGPTALQMVFAFYGNRVSEQSLTERLHTKQAFGTQHRPMIEIANEEGFYVYVNNDSSLEEIAYLITSNIPVIIHFIEPSGEEGHYSVVVDVTETHITMHDPWNGSGFKMTIPNFTERWHSQDGAHIRWIMALSNEEFPIGKQYIPH